MNYNLVLAQQQFGYPIKGTPSLLALVALEFYYKKGLTTEILH